MAATTHDASTEDPVLVAVHRLEPELLHDVEQACNKAHARYVPWTGERSLPALRRKPSILVASLRIGERRVPDDILDLATNAFPGISLLIFSREPLLRPTMSLQNGRITLVSPPLSSARIASALRSLLTERYTGYRSTDTAPGLVGQRSTVQVQRYRHAEHWVGTLACAGAEANAAAATGAIVRQTKSEGVTVVLHRDGTSKLDVNVGAIVAAIHDAKSDPELEASLGASVGTSAGVLHLASAAGQWVIYWPDPAWPLLISSPLRLPNLWDMGRTLARCRRALCRMPAAHCDTFAALTGSPPAPLASALGDGGATALEQLSGRLRESPAALSGAIVEVF